MKKVIGILSFAVVGALAAGTARPQELTLERLKSLSVHFKFFKVIERPNEPIRYVFADVGNHIHAYVIDKKRSVLEWESTTLGSPVVDIYIVDVDASGDDEMIVATAGGRVIAYDAKTYDLLLENYLETFQNISCMSITNLDGDPQPELVLLADSRINIYDGKSRSRDWQSPDSYAATEMIVANVDDDAQPEIILNTGLLIDSRFYYQEPSKVGTGGFGTRLRLLDLNGDGYPEIIGETPGFPLRIYDVYAQRVLW